MRMPYATMGHGQAHGLEARWWDRGSSRRCPPTWPPTRRPWPHRRLGRNHSPSRVVAESGAGRAFVPRDHAARREGPLAHQAVDGWAVAEAGSSWRRWPRYWLRAAALRPRRCGAVGHRCSRRARADVGHARALAVGRGVEPRSTGYEPAAVPDGAHDSTPGRTRTGTTGLGVPRSSS